MQPEILILILNAMIINDNNDDSSGNKNNINNNNYKLDLKVITMILDPITNNENL